MQTSARRPQEPKADTTSASGRTAPASGCAVSLPASARACAISLRCVPRASLPRLFLPRAFSGGPTGSNEIIQQRGHFPLRDLGAEADHALDGFVPLFARQMFSVERPVLRSVAGRTNFFVHLGAFIRAGRDRRHSESKQTRR